MKSYSPKLTISHFTVIYVYMARSFAQLCALHVLSLDYRMNIIQSSDFRCREGVHSFCFFLTSCGGGEWFAKIKKEKKEKGQLFFPASSQYCTSLYIR